MQMVLIRGLPGSGKTTLALSIKDSFAHYEADMFFENEDGYNFVPHQIGKAHEWCQRMTKSCLDHGRSVVVSNTFTTKRELQPYLDMAEEHGIKPLIVECKGKFGSVHDVPVHTIIKMEDRWEEV